MCVVPVHTSLQTPHVRIAKKCDKISHIRKIKRNKTKHTHNQHWLGMLTTTTNGWTDGQTNDTATTTIKPEWHDASKIIRIIALFHFYPKKTGRWLSLVNVTVLSYFNIFCATIFFFFNIV